MTKFSNRFNKTRFSIDTTGFSYTKLADLYKEGAGVIHRFDGCYIHQTKLGASPVAIDAPNKLLINLPNHMAGTINEILNDSEAIEAIKEGRVGFTIYEYQSHNRNCYAINFVDL